MDLFNDHAPQLAAASKRLAQRALVICENRVELLLLEVQEQGDRIIRAFWLSLGVVVFTLLAGVALTLLVTVACWNWSPLAALTILTVLYAGIAVLLATLVARMRRDWQTLPGTRDQLRKDRECLEKNLN